MDDKTNNISPLYLIRLASAIEEKLWGIATGPKYRFVENYIARWHIIYDDMNPYNIYENFTIHHKEDDESKIDLNRTINGIDGETLLKIAYDIGVDVSEYLPVVPEKFKVTLRQANKQAYETFKKSVSNIYSNPSDSVLYAASTLESLIKTILSDPKVKYDKKHKTGGLSKQMDSVIAALGLTPSESPNEVKVISSQLISIIKSVDNLRSNSTEAHGKLEDDYIIDDPLWAMLSVNAVATVGEFIWNYYNKKLVDEDSKTTDFSYSDDIPF